jgi:hypothetical protein
MHQGQPDFPRTIYYFALMIGANVEVDTFARRLELNGGTVHKYIEVTLALTCD